MEDKINTNPAEADMLLELESRIAFAEIHIQNKKMEIAELEGMIQVCRDIRQRINNKKPPIGEGTMSIREQVDFMLEAPVGTRFFAKGSVWIKMEEDRPYVQNAALNIYTGKWGHVSYLADEEKPVRVECYQVGEKNWK